LAELREDVPRVEVREDVPRAEVREEPPRTELRWLEVPRPEVPRAEVPRAAVRPDLRPRADDVPCARVPARALRERDAPVLCACRLPLLPDEDLNDEDRDDE